VSELRARLGAATAAPIVLDGGLGSMLIARGLAPGQAPEGWVLERPDDLAAVHRAYVEAGSDGIHTCTFGATPIRLAAFGLEDDCDRINRTAVELARKAQPRFVIGDVGPTGEYLPPVGQGDTQAWAEAFRTQGRALAAAGVDALHVETMSDLKEASVALAALREVAPDLPVMVSLTFDRKKRGFFTVMGNPLVAALGELGTLGADAVGANCSVTSEVMKELLGVALEGLADAGGGAPLVVQANAGQPRVTPEGVVYDQSPASFAADTAEMARAGARAVGGCCGTDPSFIRALCGQLERLGLRPGGS
jgi:methionine synthase I (cobalamin-dependent)